jgi:hypothetical protein
MTEDRDEILDDLRRALAIEPSPAFAARVRMAVAGTAQQRPQWMWARIGAVGLGAVMIAATVSMWLRPGVSPDQGLAVPAGPSIDIAGSLSGPSAAMTKSGGGSVAAEVPASSSAKFRRRVREPEIIVPPGQATALARLIEGIRDGHTTLALAKWSEGPVVVAPVPDVDPMRIDSLPEPTPVDPAQVDRTDS